MPKRTAFVLLAAALAFAPGSYAQDADAGWEADRPDFGEGTGTVAIGHYVIEMGSTFTRFGDTKALGFGEVLLRAGLGSRVEARIGGGTYSRIDSGVEGEAKLTGLSDLSLGVKWRMLDGEEGTARPDVALVVDQGLPIGSEDVTERAWETEAVLAFHWELSERWAVGANLLGGRPKEDGERFTQAAWSLTAEASVSEKAGAFVEVYGFNKEEADGSSTQYASTGVTYRIAQNLQLDARVGAGFADPRPNWFVGIGAALHF